MAVDVASVEVPGARLYYEVRGSGPVLLLIPGGPTDAGMYDAVVPLLADRYRIVVLDPRGNSRSTLTGPPQDQRVEVHADDAHRLLAAVTDEPAYVVGCGTGALVALELAARHPDQVRAALAHEPAAMTLLPDAARWRSLSTDVYDTYLRHGVAAAGETFDRGLGLDARPADTATPGTVAVEPPSAAVLAARARTAANLDFYYKHVLRPVGEHVPDLATLRATTSRVVIAIGRSSAGQPAYRAGVAVAERLGSRPAEFPGGHAGFATHPDAFAEAVDEVLQNIAIRR